MIVEVIAVGTELLLGEIVNSNAAEIGKGLAEDGFDVHFGVTVGDNMDRLVQTIETACDRSDAVLLTGGIGPTQDDMTRDAICAVLGVGLATDEAHAQIIRERLAARGIEADTALRMADYPETADPLPNSAGVALGIAAFHQGTPIFSVPGVPTEMRAMVNDQVRPRLRAASGEPAVLSSRLLHCWGFGESQIAETLDDLYQSTNPSVAFLIKGPEVRVRISAKAATAEEAAKMIAGVETEVRSRLGDAIFATDAQTVDELITEHLNRRQWTLASVETSTRGLLASRLAGAQTFAGAEVKVEAAGGQTVEDRAIALLDGCAVVADVMVAVSETGGAADGGGTADRRIGIAVRTPERTATHTISAMGDDERARQFAVPGALHVLRRVLQS